MGRLLQWSHSLYLESSASPRRTTLWLLTSKTVAVPIGWYPRLAHGTLAERANVQISGAGYAMHWPDLDEDIGIEGLLVGKQSTESAASFERWLQRRKARQPQDTA